MFPPCSMPSFSTIYSLSWRKWGGAEGACGRGAVACSQASQGGLGMKPSKGFGRTVALRAWGWRGQGCRARGGGVARPPPLEHDAQPDECDQRELVEEKRRHHGKTPSYKG